MAINQARREVGVVICPEGSGRVAAGVSLGAYGLIPELARFIDKHQDGDTVPEPGIALGGTTYGNALSLAGARGMLDEVATPEGHARIGRRRILMIMLTAQRFDAVQIGRCFSMV